MVKITLTALRSALCPGKPADTRVSWLPWFSLVMIFTSGGLGSLSSTMFVYWEFYPCHSLCPACHRVLERVKTWLSAGYFLAEFDSFFGRESLSVTLASSPPHSVWNVFVGQTLLCCLISFLCYHLELVNKNISLSISCSVLRLLIHTAPLSLFLFLVHILICSSNTAA